MDLRSPVVRHAAIVLAALIHARQRRDAQAADRLARIDRSVDFHHLRRTGCQREAVGAGRRSANRAGRRTRACARRAPAARARMRRSAEIPRRPARCRWRARARTDRTVASRCRGAEVARAEKHGDILSPVRRGVHAKARECEVSGQQSRIDAAAVEVEHVRAVADRARFAADDLVQLDRLLEAAAAMEKFQAEARSATAPTARDRDETRSPGTGRTSARAGIAVRASPADGKARPPVLAPSP